MGKSKWYREIASIVIDFLLNSVIGTGVGGAPIIDTKDFLGVILPAMLFITAGTMILLWL